MSTAVEQPQLNTIQPQVSTLPAPVYLDNGVEVNAIPLFSTDLVVITFMFKGGQWVQMKKLQSDYAIRQIKSGSLHFSSETVNEQMDYYGATLKAGATISYCFLQLHCLRRTLPHVLPLLCDILTSPQYEQPLLDNAIEEGIRAYQVNEQKVAQVNKRLFYQQLLGSCHPAAQYAHEADYHNIHHEDLQRYHQQILQLSNAIIYVTGKVDEPLLSLLNTHVGHLPCKQQQLLQLSDAPIETSPQQIHQVELNVPSVQSGLRMGKVMPDNNNIHYPAIMLTSVILGGYFGSRLMKNIRERLGFTYGIGSTFLPIPQHNIFIIATETPREHVARCVEEIKKDIQDLQEHPISQEELTMARNYMLGQFCRQTETSLSLSTLLMSQRAYGRTLTDLLYEQQKAQALTPHDIQRCAQQFFSPEEMTITAAHGKPSF